MKIGVFETVREGKTRFSKDIAKYQGEIELIHLNLTPVEENSYLVKNLDAVIYTPYKNTTEKFWEDIARNGVKYVLTCTAGFDNI